MKGRRRKGRERKGWKREEKSTMFVWEGKGGKRKEFHCPSKFFPLIEKFRC